ncbi:UDP-N-acetylmuramoylalanyl-D-glutamate--2,6-diaminopimelate ligase [Chromatium okenii]|uniref:UDP-N-acetylmuramoyl-tripeptide--D-alanyl-D- alanine ligase n=1 Tax=Chromatium okenii TaxID=61644 RepID=UPI0019079096|nr:UDP-N-acetylmuramoyl-tripeptide--D-alanyl-D-alanine ligase [Chromatium okenii]MBK1642569.1 UDP-N-acetylmuramoylalanyl-D-glutamate--2,6-diaminopimelate ligase [Chromatium okenii]
MWILSEAIAAAGGDLHGADCAFTSVGTDSRVDCSGQLFIALRGEHFDGHDHVAAAQAAGAVAALVDHPLPLDIPQWVVDDTRLGLGRLAAAWRQRVAGRVIALTGSNGKTTVKDMLAAILAQVGTVRATRGNLNNDIGMPLTLLAARDEDFVVLEMGANHPGEIAYLSAIAQPELALITNVGHAHLEGFGSLDGVAAAKGEIAGGLTADGVLVVDGASPYLELWQTLAAGRQVLTFQQSAAPAPPTLWNDTGFCTEFVVQNFPQLPDFKSPQPPFFKGGLFSRGDLKITLHLAGAHNLHNALAAATAARALGIADAAIQAGLASVRPVAGRLCPRWSVAPNGERFGIIDDTYNANPDSLAAALELLAQMDGRRWLICGDLAELGADAARLHAEVGAKARAVGIERVLTVGTLSAHASAAFGDGGRHFVDQQQLLAWLMPQLNAADRVLVKGSRSARMERIVEALS